MKPGRRIARTFTRPGVLPVDVRAKFEHDGILVIDEDRWCARTIRGFRLHTKHQRRTAHIDKSVYWATVVVTRKQLVLWPGNRESDKTSGLIWIDFADPLIDKMRLEAKDGKLMFRYDLADFNSDQKGDCEVVMETKEAEAVVLAAIQRRSQARLQSSSPDGA